MSLRTALAALALVACAHGPRPTVDLAATPATPRAAEPETAYTAEPSPLTDDARRVFTEAGAALRDGRFDDALTAMRDGVTRQPDDVALRIRYAFLVAEDGRVDDALRALREGLRHRPEDADLLTFAGGVRLRQALDGATVERRRGSVTARPSTDAAAEARQVTAWLTDAQTAFAEALRARANHLGAMQGSAVAAGRLGLHADAVRTWERVVAFTHDRDHEDNLARAVAASGDRPRAIGLFEALLAADPARGDAHAALAELYDAAGRADDARDARARGHFYQWIAPFAVPPTDENITAARTLAAWFPADDTPAATQAARATEPAVRAALTALGATHATGARELLAAFAWHHSHDALEDLAYASLRAHGPGVGDTLLELLQVARSTCTLRNATASLAQLRDPRAFAVLSSALPRDTGFFSIEAAGSLEALGDPRAVPLLIEVARRPAPPADPDNPVARGGFVAARARAALALGGFDTPESRAALNGFLADPELDLEAHAALYRLTRARPHLAALEGAAGDAQQRRARNILATYIERAASPEATAAALRARRAMEAAARPATPAATVVSPRSPRAPR